MKKVLYVVFVLAVLSAEEKEFTLERKLKTQYKSWKRDMSK